MAVTVTPALVAASVSPSTVKYNLTSAGAGTGSLSALAAATPDLLTDTISIAGGHSPLHDLLATFLADQAAARAFIRRNDISFTWECIGTGVTDPQICMDANVSANALVLNFTAIGAGTVLLTIHGPKKDV